MSTVEERALLPFFHQLAAPLSQSERAALSRLLPASIRYRIFADFGLEISEWNIQLSENEKTVALDIAREFEENNAQDIPASKEVFTIMKPTRLCNLRCSYCAAWKSGPGNKMSFEVLARATINALRIPGVSKVNFVWHGGEPTLVPISFYEKAIWLQSMFNKSGVNITNSIQTNGTMLSSSWIDFIVSHQIGIGVSFDGTRELHDAKRTDGKGSKTWHKIVRNLISLRDRGIPFGVLLVVGYDTVDLGADMLFDCLQELGVKNVALLNSLPRNELIRQERHGDIENYLPFDRYVEFLCDAYDIWIEKYHDIINVREFVSLETNAKNKASTLCVHRGRCMGQFLTIDPNGDVSACDKYVGDDGYIFGDLKEGINNILNNSQKLHIARLKANLQSDASERSCQYGHVCRGGCPHDAYVRARIGSYSKGDCCGLAPLAKKILEHGNQEILTLS